VVHHSDRRAAALTHDGLSPFGLSIAVEVFGLERPDLEAPWWYGFDVCAERPGPLGTLGAFELVARHGLDRLASADTVIVPGCPDLHGDPSDDVVAALRQAHARGARVVSICAGAFTLAAAGLHDGRTATTHWRHASLLARRYPRVEVVPDVLYVDAIAHVRANLGVALTLDRLAARAHLSPRQFSRRFRAAAGTSPGEWILRERLDAARAMLEQGDESIEHIARRVGLPNTSGFRRHFRGLYGLPPAKYRQAYRASR
jgi:AraC family transcriptional activator FtrA